MPYSTSNPPAKIKGLPKHAQDIWIAAFNSSIKEYDDEGKATATAWSAVKKAGYEQDDKGKWHKVNAITDLWESIKRLFAPLVDESPPNEMIAYLPTQARVTVTRDAQGVPRWLMIAASAVVNKVGAIDSTVLFDNFIHHAEESKEYPVLDFFHEGERVRFGVADWLRRDGALYLASGGFDDTELARGAVDGLETKPDYWGASIAYRVIQEPLVLVSEGQIPVYTDGINNFISIVPKRLAANLFTATLVAEEVKRMNTAVYEELVKLVGEERAKQFAAQVDDANRTITETGMVMRADEPQVAPVAPPAETPPAEPPIETRQDAPPEPAAEKPNEIDALKAAITTLSERIAAIEEKLGAGMEESTRAQQRATDTLAELTSRLAGVESSKARWDEWLNNVPEYIKADVEIHRARNSEPAPMSLEQIAQQSLSKMNRGPHRRQQGQPQ